MRVIAIINLKGGVGKTVTAINTAAILAAEHHKRVLIIDADSQGNTTEFLQVDNLHPATLADLLRGKGLPATIIERTKLKGVDIVPADEELMDLDLTKVETGAASARCIKELLSEKKGVGDKYDFCIIDCPPAFNAAACAALVAADEAVVPMKLDAFSLRGMANVVRQINNMKAINPNLKLAGILPTMWYRNANIIEAEKLLKKSGIPCFARIRRTPKVDDSTFGQEPVIVSSPKSAAALDYRRFVKELLFGMIDGKGRTPAGETSSALRAPSPEGRRQ